MKRKVLHKKNILIFLSMFILAAVCLYHIVDLYGPVVMPDEMGYWAVGAFISGKDWSGVMQNAPYYAYGYGILLAPLFLLNNPVLAFRMAILLNIVFLEIIYLIIIKICYKVWPQVSPNYIGIIAFAVCVYPFNTFSVQTTNAELPMVFLFILLVYTFVQYLYKNNFIYLFFAGILSALMMAFHLRNIGIILALACVILLRLFMRGMSWKQFVGASISVICVLVIVLLFKEYFSDHIYTSSEILAKNDFSGQTSKITKLFSVYGIRQLCTNIIGRLFYLGCSSFFVVYYGIYIIIKSVCSSIYKKNYDFKFYLLIFILLVFVFEVGISSVSMIDSYRIDNVLYGRYSEHVIIPILVIGLLALWNRKIKYITFTIFIGIHILMTTVMYVFFKIKNLTPPSGYSIVSFFGWDFPDAFSDAFKYSVGYGLVGMLIAVLIYIISVLQKKALFIAISSAWIVTTLSSVNQLLCSEQELKLGFSVIIPKIQQIGDAKEIYYITDEQDENTSVYWHLYKFQFFVPDSRIHVVDKIELENIPESSIVMVQHSSAALDEVKSRYTPLMDESVFVVFLSN